MKEAGFRDLPAVHRLLDTDTCKAWMKDYLRIDVVAALQETLDRLRDDLRQGYTPDLSIDHVLSLAELRLDARSRPHLRSVINAAGTVLHTNLGRAPLAAEAIDAVCEVAKGYSNLEFDLDAGVRGHRYDHVEQLICELTGAEAATVVNNNAAAVFLVLQELAKDKRVVISRGELVEIGGSFRVSEVMRLSGAQLVEVGTTNKTHEGDYEEALKAGADLVLRVHTSNFRVVGFTYQPPLASLVALAHEYGVPIYEDLGSGSLLDLSEKGIGDEPTIAQSVQAGVDIITFSGDKLLGAAQAGIICGRRDLILRVKKNQLARAVRVDKLTLAALEASLRLYRDEAVAYARIPILRMLTTPASDLRHVAENLAQEITAKIGGKATCLAIETTSQVGGGAMPTEQIPTWAIAIHSTGFSTELLLRELRMGETPIVARIAKEEVIFDVRTVFPGQYAEFVAGVTGAINRSAAGDSAD